MTNIIDFPSKPGNEDGDEQNPLNQTDAVEYLPPMNATIAQLKQQQISAEILNVVTKHRGDAVFLGPYAGRADLADIIGVDSLTEEEFIALTSGLLHWVKESILPVLTPVAQYIYNNLEEDNTK